MSTKHDPRVARQMARIVKALAAGPMTTRELAALLHLDQCTVARYVRLMLDEQPRRLHVSGRQDLGPRLKPPRLFALGDLPDVDYVPKRQRRTPPDLAARQRKRLLSLLALPQTSYQLGARMNLTPNRVRFYLLELQRSEPKQVYVSGSVGQARVYALGDLPNVPMGRASRRPKTKAPARGAWATALFTQGAPA